MQPHTARLSYASAGVVPTVQRWNVDEIEATIGEPLMIADPLLTAAQAAALLGVTLVELDALVEAGCVRRAAARRRRCYRLSDLELVDTARDDLPPTRSRRRPRRTVMRRPREGADPISLPQAAQIVGLTGSTLRRYYFGTMDLPRLEGVRLVIDRRDAVRLARHFANRVTIREAAALLGYTQSGVRVLLRGRILDRTPDTRRPGRAVARLGVAATGGSCTGRPDRYRGGGASVGLVEV
jgi:hypothetical protein